MEYKIYKLVAPEHLSVIDRSGYDNQVIDRFVLEEVSYEKFETMEKAVEYLKNRKEEFSYRDITILPYIRINPLNHE